MDAPKFVSDLPQDYRSALITVGVHFGLWWTSIGAPGGTLQVDHHNDTVEWLGLYYSVAATRGHPIDNMQFGADPGTNMANISQFITGYCQKLRSELTSMQAATILAAAKEKFTPYLTNSFCYEFSEGDLLRVQELLNELRNEIQNNSELDEDHKRRVLRRLEKLQLELHKKVADLDRFWGLVGEAGVVIGKFGNDAKPIVDRIREIAQIVWNTQARAEELPSGSSFPKLEDKSEKGVDSSSV